jgi:hypothetical protein
VALQVVDLAVLHLQVASHKRSYAVGANLPPLWTLRIQRQQHLSNMIVIDPAIDQRRGSVVLATCRMQPLDRPRRGKRDRRPFIPQAPFGAKQAVDLRTTRLSGDASYMLKATNFDAVRCCCDGRRFTRGRPAAVLWRRCFPPTPDPITCMSDSCGRHLGAPKFLKSTIMGS